MLEQHLYNKDEDPKNCPFINTGTFIPISTCKFTENRSNIDIGTSIPTSTSKSTILGHLKGVIVEACNELNNSPLQYSRSNKLFKDDVELPSLQEKDAELIYRYVARLLVTSKRTRPDIQACIIYIFIRIELPTNHYKDRHLDINILFVNKTQIFLMLSLNNTFMYFKMLLSKYNKYILNKLQ